MKSGNQTIGEQLTLLADKFSLAEIYVFGSRAKEIYAKVKGVFSEGQHSASDVDIAVEPASGQGLSVRSKVSLTLALEDLFHANRVDLVVLSEAPPFLALDVIQGELVYCRDEDAQAEHELEILRKAGDLAYYERENRKQLLSVTGVG
jgi:predicted nucleotidyltransferase